MEKDLKIEFDCQFRLTLPDVHLMTLLQIFTMLLPKLLSDFLQKALLGYAELVMARKKKPFSCGQCHNEERFIWKTRHGKSLRVLTTLSWVELRQMQIQCSDCGHKFSITRMLLGLDPYQRISPEIRRKLGLLGALTTYRVAEKFMQMFGAALDKMTIWRAVQKTGEELEFSLDPKGEARGEADGTGIGIKGIKKRGKELKVLIQYMTGGQIRVAGIDIGPYNGHWNKLFAPSIRVLKTFKNFVLVTDGDTSILEGLKNKVQVIYQRCLWHVPHQLKFALWQDRAKVKRKSPEWLSIMARIYDICSLRFGIEDEKEIDALVAKKTKDVEALIEECRARGYKHSATSLENAKPDLFTTLSNRLRGKTSSRVERLFRTVNARVDVSKWTTKGVLNVTKVRLAYYYNGFDPIKENVTVPEGLAQDRVGTAHYCAIPPSEPGVKVSLHRARAVTKPWMPPEPAVFHKRSVFRRFPRIECRVLFGSSPHAYARRSKGPSRDGTGWPVL